MSTDEKALQLATDKMIEEISPFEQQSKDLLAKAEAAEVTNEIQLASAVAIKKQITGHRKLVQDTRLSITRRIDNVKKAIMNREDEILLPLDQAQTALGEKILAYEEEQERIRAEEEARVNALIDQVAVGDVYRLKAAQDVDTKRSELEKAFKSFDKKDQDNPEIKAEYTRSMNKLEDRKAYITEEERQAAERKRLEEEAQKQSDERAKLEKEKAAAAEKERKIQAEKDRLEREKQRKAEEEAAEEARKEREREEKNRVKTGARTVTTFEITDPALVPREYCTPNESLIRAAVREGKEIPGVVVKTERKV